MTTEELKQKYGFEIVMGVAQQFAETLLKGMVTPRTDSNVFGVINTLGKHLTPKLRWEAEEDPTFKQIIPYVILRHTATGQLYATTRLGGDSRLRGQISLGLGGHMDEGEGFINCLLRELNEEIGLVDSDIDSIQLYGYLNSDASEVDRVHLGIVYVVDTHRTNLVCLEEEKLTGAWFSLSSIDAFRKNGLLESWSEMVFDSIASEGRTSIRKCDVCGKTAPVHIACSAYGAFSLAYCAECLANELEPYGIVVEHIACAGHFPDEIREEYQKDIRRMLPLWGKTEEEFIRDVDKAIQEMEAFE